MLILKRPVLVPVSLLHAFDCMDNQCVAGLHDIADGIQCLDFRARQLAAECLVAKVVLNLVVDMGEHAANLDLAGHARKVGVVAGALVRWKRDLDMGRAVELRL